MAEKDAVAESFNSDLVEIFPRNRGADVDVLAWGMLRRLGRWSLEEIVAARSFRASSSQNRSHQGDSL